MIESDYGNVKEKYKLRVTELQKTTSASKKNSGNGNESRKSEDIDFSDLPDLEWLKTIGYGTFLYFENKLTKVWT